MHNFAFTLRQRILWAFFLLLVRYIVLLHANLLLQYLYRWHKYVILHLAVYAQIRFAGKDVEQHIVEQFGLFGRRIILDDDILEFLQFHINAVVPARKLRYGVVARATPLQQLLNVAKHLAVLVLHVLAHLAHIIVIKLEYEVRHLTRLRAVECFEQFAANGRQLKVEEIRVGLFKITGQAGHRHIIYAVGRTTRTTAYKVGHRQEG